MGKKPSGKVRSYPSDVSDEEWEFWVVYLTLMNEQAKQSQADGDLRRRRLTWMALRSGRTIAQSS